MIICIYIFLFGIMQTVESIDVSLGTEKPEPETRISAPAVTSGVDEEGKAVYTYATELVVLNAQKPRLADYTRTETMLLIPDEDTTVTTTPAQTADFVMSGDDLDYTVPKTTTTTAPAETTETTTAATTAETTTAATTAATTTAAPETTTVPAYSEEEDEEDAEDIEDEDTEPPEDDLDGDLTIVSTSEAETTTTVEETTTTTTTTAAPEPEDEIPATDASNEIFTVNAAGTIVSDTALNVVSAAVMAEISDVFDDEAIKAQAIATYTYIKYYNINGQRAYIAKSTPTERVKKLVAQVLGKALYYDGTLIQAVYSASTAGRTASSKNVWGIDYPYLQSIDTGFIDKEYDINYGRKVKFSSGEIKNYVSKSTGIELSGDPSEWLKIESYTDGVFVGQMSIGGQTKYNNGTRDVNITGRVFREKIMDYDIRSAAFDIEYDAANDEFTITTYGYGHCVGFSQHGANILASKYGYTYDQILNFYYPGAVIK